MAETTATGSEESTSPTADDETALALALVWSRDEPERVGELIRLGPVFAGHRAGIVGRGGPGERGDAALLGLARVRPNTVEETGAFRSTRISRRQLRLCAREGGLVEVTNIGRGQLRIGDRPVDSGVVGVGDTVELERRLILLCVQAPATGRLVLDPRLAELDFGEADGFGLVGESAAIWALRSMIQLIAAREAHVLIAGPSGSGKELVVGALHALSRRGKRRLIARNAATIPESLVDAELFGNARNYPNPGMAERTGLIGEADRSTLFLDEIGELPHALQAHLLRVMDRGEYQRLGEASPRVADVRVIAATNREPGELKHDLRARFTLCVRTPGLEERRQDIPLLARRLVRELVAGAPEGDAVEESPLSPALVRHLLRRGYAGHVRELRELLWRSLAQRSGAALEVPDDEDEVVGAPKAGAARAPEEPGGGSPMPQPPERDPVLGLDRAAVIRALERAAWVQERAWRELGLANRHQLRRLLARLEIQRPSSHVDPSTLDRDAILGALERADGVKAAAARALGLRSRYQLIRLLKRGVTDES